MANLKSGTLIGGNMIWNAGNMPLGYTAKKITIDGVKIYTENEKPTAADVGAVSKAGDTMTGQLTLDNASVYPRLNTLPTIASSAPDGLYIGTVGSSVVGEYPAYATVFGAGSGTSSRHLQLMSISDGSSFFLRSAHTNSPASSGFFPWRRIYTDANKPTAADVGAVSKTGDTMTGDLTITKVNGKIKFAANVNDSLSGFEFSNAANQNMKVEHIIADGALPQGGQGLKFQNTGDAQHVVHLITDGEIFARNDKKVYHPGNKPTAADVGALPNTGGTVTGPINIHAASSHLKFRETDQSNKEWHIEGSSGNLSIVESLVSTRATFKAGGGTELSGTLFNNGEVKSRASNSYRMFGGTASSNIGSFFRNDNANFYLMFTDAGEAENGTWNSLRPFSASTTTGRVTIGNGLTVNGGITSTADLWVDRGSSAEPKNGVKRDARTLYMFDSGTWTGLYSAGVTDKSNTYLIRRSATVGNIVIGHGGTDLSVDASTFKYNNSNIVTDSTLTGKAIGAPKALSTEDLDTLKTAGVFSQSANSNATAERHYPENLAGTLIVTVSAGVQQRYHVYNSSRIWTRAHYGSGGWTAWARVYNTLNKPTATELGVVPTSDVNTTGTWASIINKIPKIGSNGVMEVGKYIDYHLKDSTKDYDLRLEAHDNSTLMVVNHNGNIEIGAKNSSYGHIYTNRPAFAFNKPIISLTGNPEFRECNTLIVQNNGRKHIRFDDVSGTIDGYIWKDPGLAWNFDHGNKATSVLQWTPNGELIVDGARWSATHGHSFAGQPGTKAPVHVSYGNVGGASDYYPIVRGVSTATGHGYTTQIDLGCLRGDNVWGQGVLRVASDESSSHPASNFYFKIEGDFDAPRNGSFNDVYIRSDEKLKTNIKDLQSSMDVVNKLRPVTYTKRISLEHEYDIEETGFIAQEVEKYIPDAVATDSNDMKSLKPYAIIAHLTKALQELETRVKTLEAK